MLTIDYFDNSIAAIAIDNPPVNAIGQQLRADLLAAIERLNTRDDIHCVILYCRGRTFCAGGDISEFDGESPQPYLPDVLDYIEQSPKITIAAIHGQCFGGGMELAMVCDFRLALASAQFALPEVKLGLIPGAGGSQRLPRLVGYRLAAEMLTSGQPQSAIALHKVGAVDAVIDLPLLDNAVHYARTVDSKPLPVAQRPVSVDNIDDLSQRYQTGAQAPRDNLTALSWAATLPYKEGQPKERALHLALRQSPQSKALRHVFFAERAAAKPKKLNAFTANNWHQIAVIGGGLMGAGIATAALIVGKSVCMIEQDDSAATTAQKRVADLLYAAEKRGKLSEAATTLLTRFSVGTEFSALAEAELIIEAVFEDLKVKQDVFVRVAQYCDAKAIITTNTSYLDPERILPEALQSRGAGLHFFSPAHIMKLVEVIALKSTAPQVLADLFHFVRTLKKQPVLSGICDGFIGNRILSAYRRQADYLVADGAIPSQIDRVMRNFGLPMGPYELQDMAGLQISWANRKRQSATRPVGERYIAIADQLCEAGRFGRRTDGGWYDYIDGKKIDSPWVNQSIETYRDKHGLTPQTFIDATIQNRLLAVMYNEANLILEAGITDNGANIDVVKIAGYGFPRWLGGPVYYGQQHHAEFVNTMQFVRDQSPDSWKIAEALARK